MGLLDDFNRADGDPGANWTTYAAAGESPDIVSNACGNDTTSGAYTGMCWNALSIVSGDWEVELTLAIPGTFGSNYVGVMAVVDPTDATPDRYVFGLASGNYSLERTDGGSSTTLASGSIGFTIASGDRIKIERVGSALKGYISDASGTGLYVEFASVTDATYDPVRGGFDLFDPSGGDVRVDSFGAEVLSSETPITDAVETLRVVRSGLRAG